MPQDSSDAGRLPFDRRLILSGSKRTRTGTRKAGGMPKPSAPLNGPRASIYDPDQGILTHLGPLNEFTIGPVSDEPRKESNEEEFASIGGRPAVQRRAERGFRRPSKWQTTPTEPSRGKTKACSDLRCSNTSMAAI